MKALLPLSDLALQALHWWTQLYFHESIIASLRPSFTLLYIENLALLAQKHYYLSQRPGLRSPNTGRGSKSKQGRATHNDSQTIKQSLINNCKNHKRHNNHKTVNNHTKSYTQSIVNYCKNQKSPTQLQSHNRPLTITQRVTHNGSSTQQKLRKLQ